MHIRTKRGRKGKMLKNDGFYHCLFKLLRGFSRWQAKSGRSQKEAFDDKFLWSGWQNNDPQRGQEAYFQEFGFMSHGDTAELESDMQKS